MPKKNALHRQVIDAIAAAEEKKAEDVTVLELDKAAGGFTDFFVICSGGNPRQVQAISDEVEQKLSHAGLRPTHVEGYTQAEWVLLDYVDFVVHVFSQKARHFYNLERLWKSAKHWTLGELRSKPRKRTPAKRSTPAPGRTHRSRPRTNKQL
jgi:ribosome-associated protein